MNISSIKSKHEEYIKKNYPLRYAQALKYKNHDDYLRCLGAYLLLDRALKPFDEKKMKFTKNGKPYLNDYPHFNYSHSGNFVALIVDKKHEVGIDVQVYGNHDKNYIKEWTKKEAIWKLTGDGINTKLKTPEIYKGKPIKVHVKKVTSKYVISIAHI